MLKLLSIIAVILILFLVNVSTIKIKMWPKGKNFFNNNNIGASENVLITASDHLYASKNIAELHSNTDHHHEIINSVTASLNDEFEKCKVLTTEMLDILNLLLTANKAIYKDTVYTSAISLIQNNINTYTDRNI